MGGAEVPRLSRGLCAGQRHGSRELLGKRLVRGVDGLRMSGLVCETEAYGGTGDPASHAFRRTQRSSIMFGPPGFAYVYFIYGTHHCLNAVTEPDGLPGAVLIRALIPDENLSELRLRRRLPAEVSPRSVRGVADGPGKLCQALGITIRENGLDFIESEALFFEEGVQVAEELISASPRVGVGGDEEARLRLWRFTWPAGH